jgi:RNA-binding protein
MRLSESQSKYLRRRGHALKPVVMIGAGGATDAVLAELNQALEHHELVKIRVRATDREARDELLHRIVDAANATLVQRIGHVALVYRAADEPKIALPHA